MSFSADWLSLLEECDALSADATLITPLTDKRFEIADSQEHRIIIEFVTSGQTQPLQREQFEFSSVLESPTKQLTPSMGPGLS